MLISTDKTKGLGWFTRVNKDAFWRMKILRPVLVVLADGRGFRFDTHREAELAKRNGYQDVLDRDDYLDELFLSWTNSTDRSNLLSLQGRGGQSRKPVTQQITLPKPETCTLANWCPEYASSRMLNSRIPEEILNLTIRLGSTPKTSTVELTGEPTVLEDADSLNFMATKLSQAMCILGRPDERLDYHYISPNDPFGLGLPTLPILIERQTDHIKPIDVVSTKPILGHFICFDENGNPINAKEVIGHGKTK